MVLLINKPYQELRGLELKNVHIIGTGGLAKEVIGYIESEMPKRYKIVGCWYDEPFNNHDFNSFYSGNIKDFKRNYNPEEVVILTMANNLFRKGYVTDEFSDLEITYDTYIHPSCEVSKFARIGEGCVLAPQVIITADAIIKDHTFMNTECVIGHDTVIESFCCLFPKVEVCGQCYIEENCTFGIGSIVLPGVRMKKNSKLDAMSVLRETVTKSALFVGNPAEPVKIYDDKL